MKAISLSQWQKMTPKKRSWLVCRALGKRATVFWHCVLPDGEIVGGSYQSSARCRTLIESAKTLTQKEADQMHLPFPHPLANARPEPTASYPHYAGLDHCGIRLGMAILRKHGSFNLRASDSMVTASSGRCRATGETIEEAASLLVLKQHGLIKP